MKVFKILLSCLFVIFLTGCFEMNEEINVRDNGAGDLNVSMDMGQMLDMMQAFMSPEDLEKADLSRVKDTTIYMKSIVDTSNSLTPDKKALLRDGVLNLKMNMKEKLFKIDMKFTFKTMENLEKLYESMGEGPAGFGSILKGLGGNAPAPAGREPEFKQISSYFDLAAGKNSISRKLNKEKYAMLLEDSTMMQMKQMGEMSGGMGEVTMNTVIKLPAVAKNIIGSKAVLSPDKKTVTLKNNMFDIFDHPEVFEFAVTY